MMTKEIEQLREELLVEMDETREWSEEEILDCIRAHTAGLAHQYGLNFEQRKQIEQQVYNSLRRLDIIQELIDDKNISEIMVNGADKIFYEKNGQIYPFEHGFASEDMLLNVIRQIVAAHNRVVNESSPIVDTRLADGSRVNIVLPPIALEGPCMTIRKFPEKVFTIADLVDREMLDWKMARDLEIWIKEGQNIFISGGTNSGKTTLLNALAGFISEKERVITIEDSAELQIFNLPNLVRMETRNANKEGSTSITIQDLIRTALRMRPDRIIVGEVRGGECLDMLQAMNTGHDGSLSTGHANSARDMLRRLETMVLMGSDLPLEAVQGQIGSAIDILIHLNRDAKGRRIIQEIIALEGYGDGQYKMKILYEYGGIDKEKGRAYWEARKQMGSEKSRE